MSDDTHDKLVKTYLNYFEANEKFERGPSERTKRTARRELRKLITLAKQRQEEVAQTYAEVLADIRASGKWAVNKGKAKKSKKANNKNSSDT
jgi:site-specific recombinase XerC